MSPFQNHNPPTPPLVKGGKGGLFSLLRLRLVMTILIILTYFFSSACGKKGPPTLKAYEKPETPSGLTAIHREEKIRLSWSYPDNLRSTIKGFQVLRSEGNGFKRRAFIQSDQSFFIDDAFALDVTYKYKIIARNLKDVLSADSNMLSVTPRHLPPPPEDIQFAIKSDAIEISWKSSGEGVCYNVYKIIEKTGYADTPLNREPVCVTSFKDGILLPDKSVYYTIRALRNTAIRDEGYSSTEMEVNSSHFIPSAPSDLRVVRAEDRIYLIWKESPESWVKGYRVYRKRDGEKEFTLLSEVKIPTFMDKEGMGKKVWYMIRALGPSSESESSVVEVR